MITVIRSTRSVNRAFNYNEAKVRRGVATRLAARHYPLEIGMMNRRQKLVPLLDRVQMNDRVSHSCVHISLNFHPGERLSNKKLTDIAAYFMDAISMGRQPWLAYRHFDAGHPHIHIVSVAIDADGQRVDVYRIRRRLEKKVRTETEVIFGLLPGKPRQMARASKPEPIRKIRYGTAATRQSIAVVLKKVLNEYAYGSLSELNAVLGAYHVMADRGGKDSGMRRKAEVYYHMLCEEGKKKGLPVRARSLPGKPAMALLEKKFMENSLKGERHPAMKNVVDLALLQGPASLDAFLKGLEGMGVLTASTENGGAKPAQWIYVDHVRKSAVSSQALGPAYGPDGIRERIRQEALKSGAAGQDGKKEAGQVTAGSNEPRKEMKLPPGDGSGDPLCEETEFRLHNRITRHL